MCFSMNRSPLAAVRTEPAMMACAKMSLFSEKETPIIAVCENVNGKWSGTSGIANANEKNLMS